MRCFVLVVLLTAGAQLRAQVSLPVNPWESVAPGGSYIFTDIKEAAKHATTAYRMELTGAEPFLDKKFPTRVTELQSLMALRIRDNHLNTFPSSFVSLHALVYFGSYGNAFTTVPDSLGMLGNLRFLEFHQSAFDTIPEGIYGVPRLQSLTINGNTDTICFTSSVKYFSKKLIELRLYNTMIDTLPDEFGQLTALNKLVMYKCKLNEIPAPVYQLTTLSELWLDSNSISVLPRSIAFMQGLTYLSLRGNRLTSITSSISFLKNLVVLDLRGNPMDPYEVSVAQAMLPNTRVLF